MQDTTENAELNFEQSLTALEKIIERMTRQTLSLDEMIVLYEEGLEYLRLCQKNIEAAELKIKMLNARIKEREDSEKKNGQTSTL